MNIQNNTSNTTAFQAKLIVRGSSVNSKRITNIQKIFENNTKNSMVHYIAIPLKKGKMLRMVSAQLPQKQTDNIYLKIH